MIAFPNRHRSRKPKKSRFPIVSPDEPAEIILTPGLPSMVELPNGDRIGIWPDEIGGLLVARVHLLLKRPKHGKGSKRR